MLITAQEHPFVTLLFYTDYFMLTALYTNKKDGIYVLNFFKTPQVIQASTADSIFESFHWIIDNFDASTFIHHTPLILPNSTFFPDKATNESDMAHALCRRILEHSGLSHWPFKVVPQHQFQATPPPFLALDCSSRPYALAAETAKEMAVSNSEPLLLSYSSAMMKKPMDLVASMSNLIAQHYLLQSQKIPPAGQESFNETAEIISIFMGFGVLVANTAYTFRGSCARCYDPRANRSAALSEHEAVFALALFTLLKDIPASRASGALKPYLRSTFKKAIKQIKANETAYGALQQKLAHYGQKTLASPQEQPLHPS